MQLLKKTVELLKKKNKTVSTMESCTGGALVNEITNIEGASDVLEFSAVTYSNQFKIKMGVDKEVIEKYSVYSMETAKEMSKKISLYSDSDYGVGVTGKLNRIDKKNLYGEDNIVFISIYEREFDKYYTAIVEAVNTTRMANKRLVVQEVEKLFLEILD